MRINWDDYFLSFLPIISQRATCSRGRASCIMVKENVIISTGYVGSIPSQPHCDEVGHLLIKQMDENGEISEHCIRTLHCEVNCLAFAAKNGISVNGATIYITMEPCFSCTKMLIQAGIKRIVCLKQYHKAQLSRELCKNCGIELIVINKQDKSYE